jgi:hypothetical protein
MKITDIRNYTKKQGWQDAYWYSVDGSVSPNSCKIKDVPRQGKVFVMNIDDAGQQWIEYIYPELYQEQRRQEKTRADREMLLIELELLKLMELDFVISERFPYDERQKVIQLFCDNRYSPSQLLPYIKQNFPKHILADQTRKRKLKEKQNMKQYEPELLKDYKHIPLPAGHGYSPNANSLIMLYNQGIKDWKFLLSLNSNQTKVFHQESERRWERAGNQIQNIEYNHQASGIGSAVTGVVKRLLKIVLITIGVLIGLMFLGGLLTALLAD